jgi:hypothetical protein
MMILNRYTPDYLNVGRVRPGTRLLSLFRQTGGLPPTVMAGLKTNPPYKKAKKAHIKMLHNVFEELAGVGCGDSGHLFRGAGGDNSPALIASLRANINDPVGGLDDIEVVLYN